MELNLKNRTALICGATKGIGKAIAESMCAEGVKVILLSRNNQHLKQLGDNLDKRFKVDIKTIAVDTGNSNELRKKVTEFMESFGEIQILINNSGGPEPGIIFDETPEKFEKYFRQHLLANQILTQLLLPGMKVGLKSDLPINV